ncbi:MAG: glycine--tRNA ligase subunit beta [Spiribacter sp.]|nr:glycine--tRNA ligase subunit beta [Spiribacter sp.]MDR9455185.1 glycine--tRNA ligase subunit beta [Spiribacter sp.]
MSQAAETLLFELGMEELPPGALASLSDALTNNLLAGLEKAGIPHGKATGLGAPRRLAVRIADVAVQQPDRPFEKRGPAINVAFDESGAPTQAAEGFARSCGVDVAALAQLETAEGAWLVHRGVETGQSTAELLPGIIEQALTGLPVPKRMRWGSQSAEFVRPVHWVVLLLGDAVVPATFFGVDSSRQSRGHRFHHPDPVEIARADDYEASLRAAYVAVEMTERRDMIVEGVRAEGERLGGHAVMETGLIDEVNALVEWPVVLSGSFDADFLRVPPEALVSSMQEHQRYFPVRDADGKLLPRFITVANIESRDPQRVIAGNERVIRPRLADAAFFWDQDRARPLAERQEGLRAVVFQKSLGSVQDKAQRVAQLASRFATQMGTTPALGERAAALSKADLLTEMVGEFPDLQGVMGRYYAHEDGEAEAVADALEEIYWPRQAGDAIAATPLGQLMAVVDRADTLVGIFAIGKAPTGAKDPFALRRAAVGLLRTLIEGEHAINLHALFSEAAAAQPPGLNAAEQVPALTAFCLERLRAIYLEAGFAAELFEAVRSVLDVNDFEPLDFDRRIHACKDFSQLPAAGSLAGANKRIRNILRRAEALPEAVVDANRLNDTAEHELYEAIEARQGDVQRRIEGGEYSQALAQLAELKAPVDRFFDEVMVMSDDPALQANRLALLQRLQGLFLAIADVSALPESV